MINPLMIKRLRPALLGEGEEAPRTLAGGDPGAPSGISWIHVGVPSSPFAFVNTQRSFSKFGWIWEASAGF